MPKICKHKIIVTEDSIDENGHANNVNYIQWMQDAAVLHSTAQGWDADKYELTGTTWVVRSHYVEFLLPAFVGDNITILTWVSNIKRIRSLRKYKFIRESDNKVLAKAQTDWVFLDAKTGRPKPIPDELINDFPIIPEGEEP